MSTSSSLPQDSYLRPYVGTTSSGSMSLAVVNTDRPTPVERMVENLFARQPVELTAHDEGDGLVELCPSGNCVLLLEGDDVVATSPLEALESSILMLNSDLYITGTVELEEIELPDVITALSDTTFHVRGYPESHHEKLPLIVISRYIERLSYQHGGTHRASFQRLSRLRDERGTANVYRKLSDAEVNTHVYGVPDWLPPREFDLKMHAGYGGDYDSSWFVVHRSDEAAAALVALEVGPNEWQGRWTFDADTVAGIDETIKEHL